MNTWLANVTDALVGARLQAGETVRFAVPTASMLPTLAPGDHVIVRRTRADELEPGDIVVVRSEGAVPAWIVHRLIARRIVDGGARFVTQGDNCAAPDLVWTESRLCGMVIAAQRPNAALPIDLRSRRARVVGAWLALLSRVQGNAHALPRGLARRGALKASRVLRRASAIAARRITG